MAIEAVSNYSVGLQQAPKANLKSQKSFTLNQDVDTFSLSENSKNKKLSEINVKVSNGFLGMGKRSIKGTVKGKNVDLKLSNKSNLFGNCKIKLLGTVNNKPVNLTMAGYNLEGNIADEDRDLLPYLQLFMTDKLSYDNNMAVMAMCV